MHGGAEYSIAAAYTCSSVVSRGLRRGGACSLEGLAEVRGGQDCIAVLV